MATHELVTLSLEVAVVVGGVASKLSDSLLSPSRIQSANRVQLARAHVLGRLGAILVTIAHDLQNSPLVGRKISQNRFRKFLRRLEAVCTVCASAVCIRRTLTCIKWPNQPDRERIQTTFLRSEHLAASLAAWATSTRAESYVASFETFLPPASKTNVPSLNDLFPDLELSIESPIPDAVSQLLYEIIARNTLCLCDPSTPGSLQCIQGRLRLIEKLEKNQAAQASDYSFDLAFIARADVHQPEPLRCQLMRFHVPTYRAP